MIKRNIIASLIFLFCIGAKSQNAYFTDAGSNYNFENIVAKQAFLCIQKGCFDGLKRTAFIDDSTSYDPDLIIANLKKFQLYEEFVKGDFFYKFRVDNNIPPLTFYRTFENEADSTIFLQLK